jgi:prepilin-type N-terminal cleavage/methylation domain-containing protein
MRRVALHREEGFSLPELVVGIAILGILATIAILAIEPPMKTVLIAGVVADLERNRGAVDYEFRFYSSPDDRQFSVAKAGFDGMCAMNDVTPDPLASEIAITTDNTCLFISKVDNEYSMIATNPALRGEVRFDSVTNTVTKTGDYL